MNKIFLCFFLTFLSVSFSLKAQQATSSTLEGQEFWLGFLENINTSPEVKLFITSAQASATVTVSLPASNTIIFQGTINFASETNNTKEITLNAADVIPTAAETAQNKGVKISSSAAIVVSASNAFTNSTDATSLLPKTVIGDICEYYATTYSGGTAQVVIVAMQNLAVGDVRVTPTQSTTGGKPANTSFDLPAMTAGQVYQIKANADLTGTRVESCKPVAVFSGVNTAPVQAGCLGSNHLFAQMLPTATWGNKVYASAPVGEPSVNAESVIRIVASTNNTSILVDSTTTLTIANKGGFQDINLTEAVCLVANNPISVVHLLKSPDCDAFVPSASHPAMTVLTPLDRGVVNRAVFTTINRTSINLHYLVVIAQTNTPSTINLQINGLTISSSFFKSFPKCKDFAYARIPLANGAASKYEVISANAPFVAYVQGASTSESYFYTAASQFSTQPVTITAATPACPNNPVNFSATGSGIVEWDWDFGDGKTFKQTGASPVSTTHTYTAGGTFTVKLIVKTEKGCSDTATTQITVQPPAPTFGNPVFLCSGDTLKLDPGQFDSYRWSNGSTERIFKVTSPGVYSVELTTGICKNITTFEVKIATSSSINIEATPSPPSYTLNAGQTQVAMICQEKGESFVLSVAGNPTAVTWRRPNNTQITATTITVTEAGTYLAQIKTDNGCTIRDSIIFENACDSEIFIPEGFTPNDDGVNDRLEFFGTGTSLFDLKILNRWGEVVHVAKSQDDSWDGTYRGFPAPAGTYVWVLTYKSVFNGAEVTRRGKVQLIR